MSSTPDDPDGKIIRLHIVQLELFVDDVTTQNQSSCSNIIEFPVKTNPVEQLPSTEKHSETPS